MDQEKKNPLEVLRKFVELRLGKKVDEALVPEEIIRQMRAERSDHLWELLHIREIPDNFARTMRAVHGAAGEAWLQNLPGLLADCERRYDLVVQRPFPDLSYNYVAPATRANGTAVVLKLGVPHPELSCEIAALRCFDGRGAVRLLAGDAARGVLLLQRLRPGHMLTTAADDDTATRIAAQVMQQMWRPPPAEHAFPTIADWAQGLQRLRAAFDGGVGPFPRKLVETAESLFRDLLASQAAPALLHGDLHHYNILAAHETAPRVPWLVIDPKGVVGEPAYEVGAFLRNPLGLAQRPDLAQILARRVAILAETLGIDPKRIAGWGTAVSVLSAWWSYEDMGEEDQDTLAVARHLADLL